MPALMSWPWNVPICQAALDVPVETVRLAEQAHAECRAFLHPGQAAKFRVVVFIVQFIEVGLQRRPDRNGEITAPERPVPRSCGR